MTTEIQSAAESLHEYLKGHPWFQAVGIGSVEQSPGLLVYVTRNNHHTRRIVPVSWMGFPVRPEATGRMSP